MKWLALPLLGLLATTATAQDESARLLAMNVLCGNNSPGPMLEERYGEIPMITGQSIVYGEQAQEVAGDLTMYVNPETKSFTIEFSVGGELFCVLTTGQDMQPAYNGSSL